MYEDVATLVSYGASTFDEYGNESITTEKNDVFVKTRGVYQNEYYNAAQVGLKPSITFVISNREDYNTTMKRSLNITAMFTPSIVLIGTRTVMKFH